MVIQCLGTRTTQKSRICWPLVYELSSPIQVGWNCWKNGAFSSSTWTGGGVWCVSERVPVVIMNANAWKLENRLLRWWRFHAVNGIHPRSRKSGPLQYVSSAGNITCLQHTRWTIEGSLRRLVIESCRNCKYVFSSEADRNKRVLFVHGRVRAMEIASGSGTNVTKKTHKCRVCDHEFPTRYQLLKRQGNQGHKSKRGRPSARKN